MAMRSRCVTLDLDRKRITVQTWSSDPATYTVSNKTIRTTTDNTVQDLKEIISARSYASGGSINPRSLKILYRTGELRNSDPLDVVFEQELKSSDGTGTDENPFRLRVEFDKSQLERVFFPACELNVNITTSSGQVVRLSETLDTTVECLKYTLVDKLHLENGLCAITGLEFCGGIDVSLNNKYTIGDLLKLDTVPFGDLNFHVTLSTDMRVKLSSPNEHLLRTTYMSCNLDTMIFTVKKYILDMYCGTSPNVTTDEIKVIYFGRALTDDIRIRNITTPSSPSAPPSLLTLHFMLNEPEDPGNTSFWNDLKNGRLFDFYPKEPNPQFATESQRIERLRQQFRKCGIADEPTPKDRVDSIFVPDDVEYRGRNVATPSVATPTVPSEDTVPERAMPRVEPDVEPEAEPEPEPEPTTETHEEQRAQPTISPEMRRQLEHFLRTNRLPDGTQHSGTSLDLLVDSQGTYVVDQTEINEDGWRVTVETPQGTKSVVLSTYQAIVNDRCSPPYLMVTKAGYAKLRSLGVELQEPEVQRHRETPMMRQEFMNAGQGEVAPQPQAPAPQAQPQIPNHDRVLAFMEQGLGFVMGSLRYVMIYFILIDRYTTGWMHTLATAVLIGFALNGAEARRVLGVVLPQLGIELGDIHFRWDGDDVRARLRAEMRRVVLFGRRTPGMNELEYALRSVVVGVVLFVTSMSPLLHAIFVSLLREIEEEERAELQRLEEERAAQREHTPLLPDETIDEDGPGGATGVNVHLE